VGLDQLCKKTSHEEDLRCQAEKLRGRGLRRKGYTQRKKGVFVGGAAIPVKEWGSQAELKTHWKKLNRGEF